jgi:NitT/TauT family transport system substrate-binding protein
MDDATRTHVERRNPPVTTKRFRAALIGAVLSAGLLLAGCGGDSGGSTDESGRIKITYASFAGVTGMPAKFGQEKGFFEAEGLDVTFVTAEDPVAIVSSGDAEIADCDTTSALIAAGKGAPIKIVSSMYRHKGPFYLVARNDIDRVEDLKGKTVGIARKGAGLEAYVRVILKEHGLTEKDVTLVPNGTHQEAYASLTNGQVDATIIHEPFVSLAEAEGTGKLLARGWDYLPTFHTGVEIASERFIKENPEALKKFLTAYFKAASYAKAHPEEYLDFVEKQSDVDREVLRSALEREEPIWENDPRVDLDELRDTQQIQKDLGFQDTVYDPEDLVDTSQIPSPEEISANADAR